MVNKEIPTKPTGNPTSTKEWIICLCDELTRVKGEAWYLENKHNLKTIIQQLESLDASKIKVNIVNGIFKSNNVEGCLQDIMTFIKANKKKIADAITSKGVSTSATASVDTMCINIRNIKTGYSVGEVLPIDKVEYVYKQTDNYIHRIETYKTLDNLNVDRGVSSVRIDKNKNIYVRDNFGTNVSCYNPKRKVSTSILKSELNSGWTYLVDCDEDNVVYTATSSSDYNYAWISISGYVDGYCDKTLSGGIKIPRYIKFNPSSSSNHDFKNIREIYDDRYYVYVLLLYNVSLSYRYMCVRYDKSKHICEFLACDELTRYRSFHKNGVLYLTESVNSDTNEYEVYTPDHYTTESSTEYRGLSTTKLEGKYNIPEGSKFSLDASNILIISRSEVYIYKLNENKSINICSDILKYQEEIHSANVKNYILRLVKYIPEDKGCTYYEYQIYTDGTPMKLNKSFKLPVSSTYGGYTSANIDCMVSYQGSDTYAIYDKEQILSGFKLK